MLLLEFCSREIKYLSQKWHACVIGKQETEEIDKPNNNQEIDNIWNENKSAER